MGLFHAIMTLCLLTYVEGPSLWREGRIS